jgi:hypothetical protein
LPASTGRAQRAKDELKEQRVTEYDTDHDGDVDVVASDDGHGGTMYEADTNNDGTVDVEWDDANNDGTYNAGDSASVDTNYDGTPDWQDKDGDGQAEVTDYNHDGYADA